MGSVHRLALVLLLAFPGWSQFVEVVTADDGQQVYFTTQFNLKTAPPAQRSELRAFRIHSETGAVELFAERGDLARLDASGSSDGVSSLQVSGDGQSVAFTMTNICLPGDPCRTTIQRAEVRGRNAQVLGEGTVWLSRNSRWAILNPPPFAAPPAPGQAPAPATEATLINLETQERATIPIPATRGNPLASDGTVLVRRQNPGATSFALGLLKDGGFTPLTMAGAFAPLAISDNARKLVYSRIDAPVAGQPPKFQLIARDLITSADVILNAGAEGERQDLLGLSNDGRRALFRVSALSQATGRTLIASTETGRIAELPLPEGELAATGALSGNGAVAFVFTNAGRLLRIEMDAEGNPVRTRNLLPPTPYLCCGILRFSPGEIVRAEAVLPAGGSWTNRIILDDRALPVISSDATSVTIQAPWELRTGQSSLRIDSPDDSPFAPIQMVFTSPANPRFVSADPRSNSVLTGIKIIRGDFSGPLTAQPQSGEIVHVYMTGLGPVRGAVQTGIPAPTDDIRPITGSIACRFAPQESDAETLFAGLAPGFLGFYQVTFRMPQDAGGAPLTGLQCRFETQGLSAMMSYFQAAPPPLP
jgi:uncharacterized protein (TIGR03437 family)